MLHEDVPRDDVAVVGGNFGNRPLFFEASDDPVDGLVGQFVRGTASFPIEVRRQPPSDVDVAFAARIDTLIQPREKLVEGVRTRRPVFLAIRVRNETLSGK
jgi:hypothetical protein